MSCTCKTATALFLIPGQTENLCQKIIRNAVQGVFAASLHPRTAVQVIIQVFPLTGCHLADLHLLQSYAVMWDMQTRYAGGRMFASCSSNVLSWKWH